jgi:hypothetical protein
MAYLINENRLLIDNERVFIPSELINIFPCSRRGQSKIEGNPVYYDPEARLNTERTNRLHTAINGFTDKFIVNNSFTAGDTLVFVLAGYYVEVKNFEPDIIAAGLYGDTFTSDSKIYAHLSLHDNVSLNNDYFTEILYRQSGSSNDTNYLDVSYSYTTPPNPEAEGRTATREGDFFVGVSFTKTPVSDGSFTPHDLPLFSYLAGDWKLVEASKLPKVEHDTELDSIKLSGNLTVKHGEQTSFKVTKDETLLGPTIMSSLIVGEKSENDTFADGTIKVKKHIETPALEATESARTPLLNVTNEGTAQANIDNATIIGELKVQNDGDARLSADAVNITGTLLVSQGDTTLKKLTAEHTTVTNLAIAGEAEAGSALTVNGKGTIKGDLEITTKTSTPTLDVNKITANEIWLDTVDNESIGQVPTLEIANLKDTKIYQLRFKFGGNTPIKPVESFTEE